MQEYEEVRTLAEEDIENTESGRFPFWKVLYRNFLLIIIITLVIGAAGASFFTVRSKTYYTATSKVLLSVSMNLEDEKTTTKNDLSLTKMYMDRVQVFITSGYVIDRANDDYAAATGVRSIYSGSVSVSASKDSLIMSISYTDANTELAKEKLKYVIETSVKELKNYGETLYGAKEYRLKPTQNGYTVSSFNNSTIFAILSFVVGAAVALIFVMLRYILDNKLKNEKELEEIAGVGLLAYIDKLKA